MFDISSHSKGNSGGSSREKKDINASPDYNIQRIADCPGILSELSREMRTQMNAIVAFSFLLNKRDSTDKERDEFSRHIYNACENILSLFDNFLDSAIIDTGNSKSEPASFHPDKMFRDLFSEFGEILKDEAFADLIFIPEYPESVSQAFFIDTNRYTRVIRNLFQLALQHTKSGYIKAGYFLRDNNLVFYIIDTGQGYFKCREFFQSQDLIKSLAKYNDAISAVNISLVLKLVRIMNGSVSIESNRLTGSGIYVTIPVSGCGRTDPVNKIQNSMSTI